MRIDGVLAALAGRMQRILDLLADGRRSLNTPEASQWKALALARWEMMRALDEFIDFKQACVLDRLAGTRGAARIAALRLQNERLRNAYRGFVRRWALTSPLSVDTTYLAEAFTMADRIERQVIADVQEIETLIRAA